MDLVEDLTWALFRVIAVGLALVLLARALVLWEPHEPHPCEVWAATAPAFSDVEGCRAAFEVETSARRG